MDVIDADIAQIDEFAAVAARHILRVWRLSHRDSGLAPAYVRLRT